jgi:hypothetical protein
MVKHQNLSSICLNAGDVDFGQTYRHDSYKFIFLKIERENELMVCACSGDYQNKLFGVDRGIGSDQARGELLVQN